MSKRKKEYAIDVLKREIEARKTKLKPCPFCGGKAHVSRCTDDCRYSAIYCESCGLVAKWYHDYEDEAINHWNTRVDIAETDECCEDENATCKKSLQVSRSDIERMVKLEWRKDENDERLERLYISDNVYLEASGVFGSCRMVFTEDDREYDSMAIVSDGTMDAEKQRQNAQVFLVDFICSALGVEAEK